MENNLGESPHRVLAALNGQFAWAVSQGYGTFLTVNFGGPHMEIREPINASESASPDVRRNLARRRIHIVGDWHLFVQYADWKIFTINHSAGSGDEWSDTVKNSLEELDGQRLLCVEVGAAAHSCVLKFDLGGELHISPSPEIVDDQWSLHAWNGPLVSCRADGTIY